MERFSQFIWRFLSPSFGRYHLIVHSIVPLVAHHKENTGEPMPVDEIKRELHWDTRMVRHGPFEQVWRPMRTPSLMPPVPTWGPFPVESPAAAPQTSPSHHPIAVEQVPSIDEFGPV